MERGQRAGRRSQSTRQAQDDRQWVDLGRDVKRRGRLAGDGQRERLGDVFGPDARKRGLFFVGLEKQLGLIGLDRRVHVNHEFFFLQALGRRERRLLERGIGHAGVAVNLGRDRRNHRRTGRQFDDFNIGRVARRDGCPDANHGTNL